MTLTIKSIDFFFFSGLLSIIQMGLMQSAEGVKKKTDISSKRGILPANGLQT